jgi:hypothetical protein
MANDKGFPPLYPTHILASSQHENVHALRGVFFHEPRSSSGTEVSAAPIVKWVVWMSPLGVCRTNRRNRT